MSTAPASEPAADAPVPAPRSLAIAVVLTLIIPGAGHLYLRRWLAALIWFVLALAAYSSFLVPGLILHALCLLSLALVRPRSLTAPSSAPSAGAAPSAR